MNTNILGGLLCTVGQFVEFILISLAILVAQLVGLPTSGLYGARRDILNVNCFSTGAC